jgi:hypothetical protein
MSSQDPPKIFGSSGVVVGDVRGLDMNGRSHFIPNPDIIAKKAKKGQNDLLKSL